MRVAVFSTKPYDREFLSPRGEAAGHELVFFDAALSAQTAGLAREFECVCVFVNDVLSPPVIATLASGVTRHIALRCAGFNNVDLEAAAAAGISVLRVPAYSPSSVAEHAVALLLALNRKIHRAYSRVREGNFDLEGLLGFNLEGRTVGVVGTGKIGLVFSRIMASFGCRVLAHDVRVNPECEALGVTYVALEELLGSSDVVALHCPLLPSTHHMIDAAAFGRMRRGVLLVNTSRGGLVDTRAAIDALKSGQLGGFALDVYEEEAEIFFRNLSEKVLQDDVFARLLTFPNVLITGHQGFFTRDALDSIAVTTMANISDVAAGRPCANEVTAAEVVRTG